MSRQPIVPFASYQQQCYLDGHLSHPEEYFESDALNVANPPQNSENIQDFTQSLENPVFEQHLDQQQVQTNRENLPRPHFSQQEYQQHNYQQQEYQQQEYQQQYYHQENTPQYRQRRRLVYDQKSGQYLRLVSPENYYYHQEANVQIEHNQRQRPFSTGDKQKVGKRYPVSTKSPRSLKKSTNQPVSKSESPVCHPIKSQPESLDSCRLKKTFRDQAGQQNIHERQQEVKPLENYDTSIEKDGSKTHKMDSEGDMNKIEKVDSFECLLAESERFQRDRKNFTDITKMKPVVPLSVKIRQAHQKKQETQKSNTHPDLTWTSMGETPQLLEQLLNMLKKSDGTNPESPEPKTDPEGTAPNQNTLIEETKEGDVEVSKSIILEQKSFNYQDICNSIINNQLGKLTRSDSDKEIKVIKSRGNISSETSKYTSKNTLKSGTSKPALDEQCALELHKSKSYIIDLIDKALSKELGTVPSARCSKVLFESMNTKKAVDLVNRYYYCKKSLQSSVQETNINSPSTNTITEELFRNKLESPCSCNSVNIEPAYIKHLKQLRKNYIKHIQMEIKQLEDLEQLLEYSENGQLHPKDA